MSPGSQAARETARQRARGRYRSHRVSVGRCAESVMREALLNERRRGLRGSPAASASGSRRAVGGALCPPYRHELIDLFHKPPALEARVIVIGTLVRPLGK